MTILSSCGGGDCVRGDGDVITRSMDIPAFDAIVVQGPIDVRLIRSPKQQVDAEAQPNLIDLLDTEVIDGVWSIRTRQCIRSRRGINIQISLPTIRSIAIHGSGDVSSGDVFETSDLHLEIAGSGDLELAANANSIRATIAGSGDITLSGGCERFESEIRGSGDINAGDLKTVHALADIVGSGDIQLHVSEVLEANVTGSGNIRYSGSPSRVNHNITGSGNISTR